MRWCIHCPKCKKSTVDIGVITPRFCVHCDTFLGVRGHIGETWGEWVYVESVDTNIEGYSRVKMRPFDHNGKNVGIMIWDTKDDVKNFPHDKQVMFIECRIKGHSYMRTDVSHVKIIEPKPDHPWYENPWDKPDQHMWSP